jgi:hypothetical protein
MEFLWEGLVALLAIYLVFRLVTRFLYPRSPAEPVDDPFAPVTAPRQRGPKSRSGAVALEEPDDNDPADCFPPRNI